MRKRPAPSDSRSGEPRSASSWTYWRVVIGVCAGVAIVVVGGLTGHVRIATPAEAAEEVDCSVVKCIALTFDDGPSPYTDRLLQVLKDNDAKATFFEIGNKVAANPDGAKRVVAAHSRRLTRWGNFRARA